MSNQKFNIMQAAEMKISERIREEVGRDLRDGAGRGHYWSLGITLALIPLEKIIMSELQDLDVLVIDMRQAGTVDGPEGQGIRFMAAEFLALYFEDLGD